VTKLQRTTFKTSRAAQYVEARALQAMTGQSIRHFVDVVVKELMDNALDACETAGVPPEVGLEVARNDQEIHIAVTDNGPGIPPETVRGALDFDVFVSDKAAYRSPTRGAQGNALKAVVGIPHALGSLEPVVIEARGLRYEVRVWKDPAGELRVQYDETDIARADGTRVEVRLPSRWLSCHLTRWERAYALFNPHASIKIHPFSADVYQGNQVTPQVSSLRIFTDRPATLPSASSTCQATRRALTGTTRRRSRGSSTATSAMLVAKLMEAQTSSSETS
jgi:DNA topoisomerase VI subunit B